MPATAPTPARLEAFSDGVIAVIITVMVLEIKIPHPDGFAGLRILLPSLLIYLLSFAFTGTYWLNHQALIRRVERAPHTLQLANLLFLFVLSLLPFSTAYLVEKHLSSFATVLYDGTLLVVALAFYLMRMAVHGHLRRNSDLQQQDLVGRRNHLGSMAVYSLAAVLALSMPRTALALVALLTLLWIAPNLSAREVRDCL